MLKYIFIACILAALFFLLEGNGWHMYRQIFPSHLLLLFSSHVINLGHGQTWQKSLNFTIFLQLQNFPFLIISSQNLVNLISPCPGTLSDLSLNFTFQILIPVFTCVIEVWGCTFYSKYLSRIDKLFARCYKLGHRLKHYWVSWIFVVIEMWSYGEGSLPPTLRWAIFYPHKSTRQLRTRSHNYILPNVRTSSFKSVFINRCLFNSN